MLLFHLAGCFTRKCLFVMTEGSPNENHKRNSLSHFRIPPSVAKTLAHRETPLRRIDHDSRHGSVYFCYSERKTRMGTPANPQPETKTCESCDAVIGKSEKVCPKCQIDFEELEDAVATVGKAQSVLAKRKATEEAAKTCPKCKAAKHDGPCKTSPTKKKSVFQSLGAALRKKA
jgi:hypothetical protein